MTVDGIDLEAAAREDYAGCVRRYLALAQGGHYDVHEIRAARGDVLQARQILDLVQTDLRLDHDGAVWPDEAE